MAAYANRCDGFYWESASTLLYVVAPYRTQPGQPAAVLKSTFSLYRLNHRTCARIVLS